MVCWGYVPVGRLVLVAMALEAVLSGTFSERALWWALVCQDAELLLQLLPKVLRPSLCSELLRRVHIMAPSRHQAPHAEHSKALMPGVARRAKEYFLPQEKKSFLLTPRREAFHFYS